MRWLFQVHLPPRRLCLQAGLQVAADFHLAAGSQAVDFHVAAGSQAVDFHAAGLHAPADSTAHRCPGVGSALEAVLPGRRALRAPRIFPSRAQAGLEAWLRKATLPAVGLNRAPRIFLSQAQAVLEA
jgi:hypothetical protein